MQQVRCAGAAAAAVAVGADGHMLAVPPADCNLLLQLHSGCTVDFGGWRHAEPESNAVPLSCRDFPREWRERQPWAHNSRAQGRCRRGGGAAVLHARLCTASGACLLLLICLESPIAAASSCSLRARPLLRTTTGPAAPRRWRMPLWVRWHRESFAGVGFEYTAPQWILLLLVHWFLAAWHRSECFAAAPLPTQVC